MKTRSGGRILSCDKRAHFARNRRRILELMQRLLRVVVDGLTRQRRLFNIVSQILDLGTLEVIEVVKFEWLP